ncbi:GOLPH3/VPS74 family protein [Mobilicoccus massiliensis]|uniref:GOLPH3/VPS74 family protein n=1 Tax=Mobilicoccus massiliensis TaxID=1522310 RepID=UPI00058DB835|nr:GPP34 family phosphoprotein [Mobilicoccus massiliensis]
MSAALVDQMLLLGSTPEGRHALRDLPTLVAGAAMADLAARGRISCPARTVQVDDDTPTGHPVLDRLLARIADTRRGRAPWRWIFDTGRSITQAEREHLVQTGVLGTEEDVVLGMLPRTRHPLRDLAAREQVVERVRSVVLAADVRAAAEAADPQTRMLVDLLGTAYHSRRTAAALFPELDARALRTRLKTAPGKHWVVTATAHAVRLVNAARA